MGAVGRRARRRATTLAFFLPAIVFAARPALAVNQAGGGGTMAVSSATWGATPTLTSSGTPSPGTVSIAFSHTLVLTTAPQYFYVANTGTRSLTRTSYRVDGIAGTLLGNPVITLAACVGGAWNTSTHACSGGVNTTVGTFTEAAPGPVSSTVVAAASGSRVQLQASVSSFGVLGSFTAVFGASVTSSGSPRQLSGPLTTNA